MKYSLLFSVIISACGVDTSPDCAPSLPPTPDRPVFNPVRINADQSVTVDKDTYLRMEEYSLTMESWALNVRQVYRDCYLTTITPATK